jgi:hypothetical protein
MYFATAEKLDAIPVTPGQVNSILAPASVAAD